MKIGIIYSSLTGNTKKVAEAIYEEIKGFAELKSINDCTNIENYDVLAIGYWVDKGYCDEKLKELIEGIHGKKIVLFGTLGASNVGDYYEKTKKNIESLFDSSNEILGSYLCQGKINPRLKTVYEERLRVDPSNEHIKAQLINLEKSQSHPDERDLAMAKAFIKNSLNL